MFYIICYNSPILNLNPKTQARKRFIIYNTITSMTTLIKHVNLYHYNILNFFDEGVNNFWKKMKDNVQKKTKYVFNPVPYLIFLLQRNL
jgi:hypothetical protein